jgi:pimeloyl-ACP methyl ester carboxylesterase
MEPFTIAVLDDVLDDVTERLRRVRWAEEFGNEDWRYGTSGAYLREVVEYWLDGYDWRAQEAEMNSYRHYRTTVQGVPIHFMHVPSPAQGALPLILSHGWPWTFWDFRAVIGPLTDPVAHGGDAADAFDLVIPSLPGYAFSTPLQVPGINWWRTADLWADLMQELGHTRFGASGGDWGTLISTQLAHKYPDRVIGAHVSSVYPIGPSDDRPWSIGAAVDHFATTEAERAEGLTWERRFVSHMAVHHRDPYTLAHALSDSPVGLASWLIERRREWSDCGGEVERIFSKDDLLNLVMLYWINSAFSSSVRYYAEADHNPWTPSRPGMPIVEVPMGISLFEFDRMPGPIDWAYEAYNVQLLHRYDVGGHFSSVERPDAIVADIRETFRPLRAGR